MVPYNLQRYPVMFTPYVKLIISNKNFVHFYGSFLGKCHPNFIESSRSIFEFQSNLEQTMNISVFA